MSQLSELVAQRDADAQRVQRTLADLRALTLVIVGINRSLDLDTVLQSSLDGITQVIGGSCGCFLLIGSDTKTLQLAKADTLPPSLRERLQQLTLDQELDAQAFRPENRLNVLSTMGERVNQVLNEQRIDAYVLMPLTALGHAVGALLVVTDQGHVMEPWSVDLLMSIGEQVGMAIENARLLASVRESAAWHSAFMENSLDAFWEGEWGGRITYVNDATCKLLGYDRAMLLQMNSSEFSLQDPATRQAASMELQEKGFLVNQVGKIRTHAGEIRTINYSTRVVRDRQGNPVRHQSISHDMTEQENLLAMLRHHNEELDALNAIANILNHPLELDRSLDQVCEQIVTITGMDGVAICLNDERRQFSNLVAYRGLSDSLVSQVRQVGLDDLLTRSIAVDGRMIAVDDVAFYNEPGFAGPRAEGYHAGICMPIRMKGNPVGAVFVGSKVKTRYNQEDISLLDNVSNQIGVALENSDLFAQMQRRVKELDGLAKLSAACAASLDLREVSEIAVEWMQKLLDLDLASLRLLQGRELHVVAFKAMHPEYAYLETISLGNSFNALIERRSPLVSNDLAKEPSAALEGWRDFQQRGIPALVVMPLSARDQVIGALTAAHSHPHVWSQSEIDLLQTIANQVANAVDNARLFQNVLTEQRKIQAIFDSGFSGLYATDAQSRIVMFNRVAEQATGWTLNEVQGKSWQQIFNDPAPLIQTALERKESVYDSEGRALQARDGHLIPVAEAVAPLFDEKGQVSGAVGAFWDLTKEMEAKQSYARFLTMVAHQLRSPLSAVLSALQLLERRNLSTARRTVLWGVIRSDGARLKKFANEFLELEGTVKSPRPLQLEPFSIVTLARRLAPSFKNAKHPHHFRVISSKPDPIVYADTWRVENVLRNLMDNAVNYSPVNSFITIKIQALSEDSVDIAVHDQGNGIPSEDRERIFEPFYRSSKISGQPTEGHGLGLVIARTMVDEMGGKIWLDEQKSHGTTFHFTLRRYQ